MTPDDYRLIFQDHRVGKKILEELEKRFRQPPVTDGGIDAVLKTYTRMGEANVIAFIQSMIERE